MGIGKTFAEHYTADCVPGANTGQAHPGYVCTPDESGTHCKQCGKQINPPSQKQPTATSDHR